MIFRIINNYIRSYNSDWRMLFLQLVAFLVALYFAIVLHEIAHGLVAKWQGDLTAKANGRLSLNPVKHVDVVGAVMMLIVGIGWAKPVPVNPNNFRDYKKGMILVSLAGIIANLILATLSLGLMAAMVAILKATYSASVAGQYVCWLFILIFEYSAVLNISLAGFNLLPLFPLDGFRLVEVLTKPNNGYVTFMRKYGIYVYLVLVGLSVLSDATGWKCDVLGMYIGVIQSGMEKLIYLILGTL